MGYRRGNKITIGSTRSGKSWGEIPCVLDAANERMGIVVLDPHQHSLAWNCLGHLVAEGHKKRIIYDNLGDVERTPKYRFLRRSRSANPMVRAKEHQQQAEQFAEVLTRRRDQQSLAGSPQTEEWVMKATRLLLEQPHDYPASDLRFCLSPGHRRFEQLFREVADEEVRFQFEDVASGKIKAGQFAAARRLIESVCGSPSVIARCGTGFDLGRFLDDGGILLIEGGDISQPVMQTILGSISLAVFQYVRTRTRNTYILLVMDEVVNANLISAAGHEARACAELQKRFLDLHFLSQDVSFPNPTSIFTNCRIHEFYFCASKTVERFAMDDLGDNDLQPPISQLQVRERWVKDSTRVYHDFAPELDSPFIYPELTDRRVRAAIDEIRQRPEYGEEPCSTGSSGAETSSPSPISTPAPPGTFSDVSPARRLRTKRSQSSESNARSASSEK